MLVDRDQFVRDLWLAGLEFVGESPRYHVFRGPHGSVKVPKVEHLDHGWVEEQTERSFCVTGSHAPRPRAA